MSFDTKYRPKHFSDVVGQEGTIEILRRIIQTRTGFQQSYIFAGAHGSGKTTLGRLLARSLLCDTPTEEGEFCGECSSCISFEQGSHECFIEVDAATNSGKDDMREIVDQLQYTTFSGSRRLYLFDESHQLTKNALDAILKPMEDSLSGSEDRKLVCIFCTTEPEKMRATILSRCAPVFQIRKPPIPEITDRISYICDEEKISYDREALSLIVEISESHIRDSLKAVEGIALLGPIDRDNVIQYLHLDANSEYVKILKSVGEDIHDVIGTLHILLETLSPALIYENLAETAMLAYRTHLGVGGIPSYWDREDLIAVAEHHDLFLVQIADRLSSRPKKASKSMLECDMAFLHHARNGGMVPIESVVPVLTSPTMGIPSTPVTSSNSVEQSKNSGSKPVKVESVGKVSITDRTVYMPEVARSSRLREVLKDTTPADGIGTPAYFFQVMGNRLREIKEEQA